MKRSGTNLDNDALELYQQLDGIDPRQLEKISFTGDGFSQSLSQEEMRNDAIRLLLADLCCQVSSCLLRSKDRKKRTLQSGSFDRIKGIIEKLARNNSAAKTIIIRYKGDAEEADSGENIDYEMVFGEYYLDLAVMEALVSRSETQDTGPMSRLADAFKVLWECSVYNLLLRMPAAEKDYKRLWIGIQILHRYFRALQKKSPVQFTIGRQQHSYPIVTNESDKPDPNLTLLAIFNKVPSNTIQRIVQKIIPLIRESEKGQSRFEFTTAYDAILGMKRFQEKLSKPPLELNSVKWLIVDSEQMQISSDMARVARYVVDNFDGSGPETIRVLKSVYGDDYERIDSNQVAQRLEFTSDLLETMDKNDEKADVETEVLENVWTRLGFVNDGIYDNLIVEEDRIKAHAPGKKTIIAKIHDQLIGLVGFYKSRAVTKKKMTDMIHQLTDFDQQDFETIARDFDISTEEAGDLIITLKNCFDDKGNFRKNSFVKAIPMLERYESKIFDFLWHNLKETLHQADRTAFLDALQLLVDRIRQRKNSLSVLLQDLASKPSLVRFADHKAFMLGNRLLREYSGKVMSYQITPEDVLQDTAGLDQRVASYAAWKVDREQEAFYEKMRTIHRRLIELLDSDATDSHTMTANDLLALEREAYIFFSQCGGSTSWSVLISALKEYGNPESEIYRLKAGKTHLADLLQLLKIIIRGVAAVGGSEERALLESVKYRLEAFNELISTMHQEDLLLQIREVVDESILRTDARSE